MRVPFQDLHGRSFTRMTERRRHDSAHASRWMDSMITSPRARSFGTRGFGITGVDMLHVDRVLSPCAPGSRRALSGDSGSFYICGGVDYADWLATGTAMIAAAIVICLLSHRNPGRGMRSALTSR